MSPSTLIIEYTDLHNSHLNPVSETRCLHVYTYEQRTRPLRNSSCDSETHQWRTSTSTRSSLWKETSINDWTWTEDRVLSDFVSRLWTTPWCIDDFDTTQSTKGDVYKVQDMYWGTDPFRISLVTSNYHNREPVNPTRPGLQPASFYEGRCLSVIRR